MVEYLAGGKEILDIVLSPFDNMVCEFLDELSRTLRYDKEAKQYPDVMTFAFWCRKANIQALKHEYENSERRLRIGRGMVFHIAPSNVPVNAGFSYVFALLSGNASVVRVSNKKQPQVLCLCRVMDEVLTAEKFSVLRQMTSFLTYEKENEATKIFSSQCAIRLIWGGDETIQEIRKIPLSPRSTEITFADRYSFGIIDGRKLGECPEKELIALAESFYNDTYLVDQNACSTPHLIFWMNSTPEVKERFWQSVYEVAARYDLTEQKVSEKITQVCEKTASLPEIISVDKYKNRLYVVNLCYDRMQPEMAQIYRGKYGLFYQTDIQNLSEIFPFIDEKVQSCTVFGVDKEKLARLICENNSHGIDRIVPFGKALDIGLYWDGYDLIRSMSRCIV